MKIGSFIRRMFIGDPGDPSLLDHVPVNTGAPPIQQKQKIEPPGHGLPHHEKLALAAKRYGAPFKCAADDVPHEVLRDALLPSGTVEHVKALETPPANVAIIGALRARAK